jgi:hypothetical protein
VLSHPRWPGKCRTAPRGMQAPPPELVEAGARHEQQAAAGQLLAQAAAVGARLIVQLEPA